MKPTPPLDSKIKIGTLNGYEHIIIPYMSTGITRFLSGGFLLLWLAGWYSAFSNVLSEIIAGKGDPILFIWLSLWSIGGLYVARILYKNFRKPVPEQLLFNKPNLSLDTGRRRIEFSPEEFKSMKLRDTNKGNRLTIDKGSERIEIASKVTGTEKEWLFRYLQDSYS